MVGAGATPQAAALTTSYSCDPLSMSRSVNDHAAKLAQDIKKKMLQIQTLEEGRSPIPFDDDNLSSEEGELQMHQLQETSKSQGQLRAELVNLVKLVTKFIEEQSWQQQATGQSVDQSDKFKEAFISQLGFYELVQILDWRDESVAYPALQLINQVCEKNLEK